jgi:cytochrome P450
VLDGCPRAARDDGKPGCPARRGPDGSWQLSAYEDVRAALRSTDTRQAGFGIEYEHTLPKKMKAPVLWRDGLEHREHRRRTARFFTERRVESRYRDLMRRSAEAQLATLRRNGQADLAELSFAAAVTVVGEVIGLAGRPGMAGRLERFFTDPRPGGSRVRAALVRVNSLVSLGSFYLLDVRPAIRARRRAPQDDLVSHMVTEGASSADVFGECMTFAAAGMITTREFITIAAWYLFRDDALRVRWCAGDRAEREAILHELLRLEPVVSALHRTTTADVPLPDGTTIPAGARLDAMLVSANLDPEVVGAEAGEVRPGRVLPSTAGLAFGDGPHKCPGSHVAIQESEIFLSALFTLPDVRMSRAPDVRFRAEIEAYELSGLVVAVG